MYDVEATGQECKKQTERWWRLPAAGLGRREGLGGAVRGGGGTAGCVYAKHCHVKNTNPPPPCFTISATLLSISSQFEVLLGPSIEQLLSLPVAMALSSVHPNLAAEPRLARLHPYLHPQLLAFLCKFSPMSTFWGEEQLMCRPWQSLCSTTPAGY